MKNKLLLTAVIFALYISFHAVTVTAQEPDMLHSLSFKATVIKDGQEIEWEYTNPDEYEWEKGNTVIKGEEARKEVKDIFAALKLSKDTQVEKLVRVLEKKGYPEIDRLDIRWTTGDGELYTWLWER